jgi:uncharacterized protein YneF (UPF0154 family)
MFSPEIYHIAPSALSLIVVAFTQGVALGYYISRPWR